MASGRSARSMRPGPTAKNAAGSSRPVAAAPRRPSRRGYSPTAEVLEPRILLSGNGDDYPDDFGEAFPLAADSFGFVALTGSIGPAAASGGADVDAFLYEAPTTTMVEVRLEPLPGGP